MTYNHHSHVFTFPREFYGGTKLVTRFPRRRFLKAQPFPLPPTSYSLVHNILLKKQSKGTCKALKYVEGWRKQRRRRRRKRHKDNYKASLGLQKKEKKKAKKEIKTKREKKRSTGVRTELNFMNIARGRWLSTGVVRGLNKWKKITYIKCGFGFFVTQSTSIDGLAFSLPEEETTLSPPKKHPLPNHSLPKTRATEETCWEYMCERVCRGEEMRSGMWDWRVEGEVGLRGWRVAPAFTSRSVNARLVVANRKGDTCNMFLSIVRPLDFFLFWGFALFSLIFFFFWLHPVLWFFSRNFPVCVSRKGWRGVYPPMYVSLHENRN